MNTMCTPSIDCGKLELMSFLKPYEINNAPYDEGEERLQLLEPPWYAHSYGKLVTLNNCFLGSNPSLLFPFSYYRFVSLRICLELWCIPSGLDFSHFFSVRINFHVCNFHIFMFGASLACKCKLGRTEAWELPEPNTSEARPFLWSCKLQEWDEN